MRRVLLVLALCLTAFVPIGGATAVVPAAFHGGHGITVVSATQSDARTWRLVVSTAQLSRPVRVNVLLPDNYSADAHRYPVLYLFHGTSGGADDWLAQGNAEAATAGLPLIVVMPDAGYDNNGGSWFTNWVDQQTPLGTANWESFHIGQLVPWIDGNLRTVPDRSGRAVAGLSQGGFGSTSYAARHPELFDSVASFSGAPDIDSNPVAQLGASVIISATAAALDGVEPDAFFGSRLTHEINWSGPQPGDPGHEHARDVDQSVVWQRGTRPARHPWRGNRAGRADRSDRPPVRAFLRAGRERAPGCGTGSTTTDAARTRGRTGHAT